MKIKKSAFDGWCTPKHILNAVVEVFGVIDCDPFSNGEAIVPAAFKLTKDDDGFKHNWAAYMHHSGHVEGTPPRVFVNPPYDCKTLTRVADKCIKQELEGCEIITLVPSKTDQAWFATCLDAAASACFVRGRVAFGKGGVFKSGGQFACTMFYFGKDAARFKEVFAKIGACI